MARKALIIGGTGQIGQATARRLLAEGWDVSAAARDPAALPDDIAAAGAKAIAVDRETPGAVAAAVAGGIDALIDCVAYDDVHARQLLGVQADVGAFVVISSGSVYADAKGRTLDEAAENGFPEFPVPLLETQATVAGGPATYSTRKVLLEQFLLNAATRPLAILRAGAIYGPGSRHPREWWFARRIRDGRRRIPLAFEGRSRFHGSATANIAELIVTVLAAPTTAVLHAADPEALSVIDQGRAIAATYGVEVEFIPLPGPPKDGVGATPWSIPRPIVFDMSRAEALGYRPAVRYEDAIGEACRAAQAAAAAGVKFPDYIEALFDYAAEDALFART